MSAAARENFERLKANCIQEAQEKGNHIDGDRVKPAKISRKKPTLTPDMAGDLVKEVVVSEDGNEVKILMSLDPSMVSTAQQKGAFVGKDMKVHFFTKAKIAKAQKAIKMALSPYAHHSRKWGEVPIEVSFNYFFSYPSGTPKKDRHRIGPMNERPDVSNITKGICDAMTEAGFWPDDSFINKEINRKCRTTGPACTKIVITNLMPKFEALYRQTEAHDAPTLFSMQPAPKPAETNPLSDLAESASQTTSN